MPAGWHPPDAMGVLVTGGAGGIGQAIVRRFVADGQRVVFSHLGQEVEAEALVAELRAQHPQADVEAHQSDVADEDLLIALVAHARPSIVVHAAGIARDGMCWKQATCDFDQSIAVNLRSAWLLLHHAAPGMRQAKTGRFLFLGSINGLRGKAGQTAYAASKAGLIGLARSAARELGSRGITVNVVAPGWVDTPLTLAVPAEFRAKALGESLTGRLGRPEDIAAAVAFLASEEAGHITGQVLNVDGGQSL